MFLQKLLHCFIGALFLVMPLFTVSQETIQVIPKPNEIDYKKGFFTADNIVLIEDNTLLNPIYKYVSETLQQDLEQQINTVNTNEKRINLRLKLDSKLDKTIGAYQLVVNKKGVEITSANEQGLFYGFQTLRQSIKTEDTKWTLPYMVVNDVPRFEWRAFMLDEGRYFKGKKQVLKLLDEMARLKMNVFHWHLVDDQGWRIEIKKYPLLTEIGAKRKSTQIGPRKWQSPIQSGEPHEGFYTQAEIKEIIEYAKTRQITIVPEIEMPGHASAAIAAYPWLGTTGQKIQVPIKFGVSEDIFNVAKPEVYEFLTDVLDEVMALFPSKVIHIGGDEAKYEHWEKSDAIKNLMQQKGFDTYADVQVDFTNRISKYLESKGRKMMGWNEILGDNVHEYQAAKDTKAKEKLSKKSVIHFWKGDIALMTEAAANGYAIVNSLHSNTYLDYAYTSISLEDAYNFNPIPKSLDLKYQKNIKGLGTQMWGEWIPTGGIMDYMTFPRIAAFAEVGWTQPENKQFDSFLNALSKLLPIWDAKEIYYAPLNEAMPKK